MTRYAIISDIHSNASALDAALQRIAATGVQHIICLGDLLNYGPQPNEVIALLQQISKRIPTTFIIGNHDWMVFQCQQASVPTAVTLRTHYPKLPAYIAESIIWTVAQLTCDLRESFAWVERFTLPNMLFAHANPFAFGDWTYIRDEASQQRAIKHCRQSGLRLAAFGHSHRQLLLTDGFETTLEHTSLSLTWSESEEVILLNPGTIGQPRGTASSFALLDADGDNIQIELCQFDYDAEPVLDLLAQAQFTTATFEKLCNHFPHRELT